MNLTQSLARAAMLVAVIATVQILLQYPNLPTPLATRFNWPGHAVGWTTPRSFVTFNLIVIAIVLAVTLFLPSLMGKRPRIRWNLPNREYWLAPERVGRTVDYIKRQLAWFGVITLLLLMAVFQLVADANTRDPPVIDNTRLAIFLAGYIAFMLLWAWAYWRKFSRLPPEQRENPFG